MLQKKGGEMFILPINLKQAIAVIVINILFITKKLDHEKIYKKEFEKIPIAICSFQNNIIKQAKNFWKSSRRMLSIMCRLLTLKAFKKIIKDYIFLDILYPILDICKKTIKNFTIEFREIKEKGIFEYFCTKFKKLIEAVKNIPQHLSALYKSITDGFNDFLSLTLEEKMIFILKMGLFLISTYVGYNIPDLDIVFWGIGSHRNFFTHSALPGILILGSIKFIQRIMIVATEYLNEDEQDLLPYFKNIQSILGVIPKGVFAGLSVHLLEDLVLDGSQTMRGLPIERSSIPDILRTNYRIDNGYLTGNSLITIDNSINDKS